jgi:hypothetical protein
MNTGKKLKDIAIDDVMFLGLIVIVPMVAVLVISLILFNFLKSGNNVAELIQTWIVMGLSFVIIPGFIVNKKYRFTAGDIGIVKIKLKEILVGAFIIILMYGYLTGKTGAYSLLLLSLQTIAVAVCEEMWARGILFYVISKFTSNRIVMILLSSVIFTFLIHINRGFYNNLIYRLPGAVLMCVVYDRSKKLHYSILVHFVYNMLTSV